MRRSYRIFESDDRFSGDEWRYDFLLWGYTVVTRKITHQYLCWRSAVLAWEYFPCWMCRQSKNTDQDLTSDKIDIANPGQFSLSKHAKWPHFRFRIVFYQVTVYSSTVSYPVIASGLVLILTRWGSKGLKNRGNISVTEGWWYVWWREGNQSL